MVGLYVAAVHASLEAQASKVYARAFAVRVVLRPSEYDSMREPFEGKESERLV